MRRRFFLSIFALMVAGLAAHRAKAWSDSYQSFGGSLDCVDCQQGASASFPMEADQAKLSQIVTQIQGTLGTQVTGFSHGNAVGGMARSEQLQLLAGAQIQAQTQAWTQYSQLAGATAPFLVPAPMRFIPTQAELGQVVPSAWLQSYQSALNGFRP